MSKPYSADDRKAAQGGYESYGWGLSCGKEKKKKKK